MSSVLGESTAPDVVTSFDRGLQVIEVLAQASRPMGLAEVARECDTTRATARRLLLTLERLDLVASVGSGFSLRPAIMGLGDAYLTSLRLPQVAHHHLERLSATVQDTCSLTILDGGDVVYVDRVKASRLMAVHIDVGTRFPAYATSTGRVLLSGQTSDHVEEYLAALVAEPLTALTQTSTARLRQEIAKARRNDYAVADQELDVGLRSVAAPVRDGQGDVVAAVNVSTPVTRTSLEQLRRAVLPELLATARAISHDLARDDEPRGA